MLLDDIASRSPAFLEILTLARRVASTDVSILISGETGTGKDFIAEAIHEASSRKWHPFLKIDCASIPAPLAESEFFGYEKGAFSDASQSKQGKLQLAKGGTVYLDGINHLSGTVQSKLLRFVQDRIVEPLGGSRPIVVDCRIISSCSEPLEACLKEQQIRQDLYFRISGVSVELPPLRNRIPDIEILARGMLRQFEEKYRRRIRLSSACLDLFRQYHWPGNIRELRNVLEHAVIHGRETITPGDVSLGESMSTLRSLSFAAEQSCTLEDLEKRYIAEVLQKVRGHYGKASKILDINRKTLLMKRKKYGLNPRGESR